MKNISFKMTIIATIIVFILSFGATYAINVWSSGNTLISGTTKCFKVNYTKGQDINFTDSLVALTSFDKDKSVYTTLSISKNINCDVCGKGSISANITSSIDLSSGGLSYKIYQGTNEVKSGSITNTGITTLYDNFDIQEINSITFTIYFYLDASKINNNYLQTSFTGKIYAEAKSTNEICNNTNSNNLYTILASNATLDTNIDFSQISSDTNGKGIYIRSGTEEEANPIYYYRGDVDNNNVLFANFCWKIVRTTETGGIKLIYNGLPSNGTCNNTGSATSIGTSVFNTNYTSPAYVGYMYGNTNQMTGFEITESNYIYGSNISYANGLYTLTDTITTNDINSLTNHHYTCKSTSLSCEDVLYIYYIQNERTDANEAFAIKLSDGMNIDESLNKMFNYNKTDSTLKTYIDNWYSTNMTSYTNKLEDTVWCNDRNIERMLGLDSSLNFELNDPIFFHVFDRVHFISSNNKTCIRNVDRFTVNKINGNGNLTYPVGLITADEVMYAGILQNNSNGEDYYNYNSYLSNYTTWTMSPYGFRYAYDLQFVLSDGHINGDGLSIEYGVSPCVSLASGTEISSGYGTANSPYIVE